LKQRSGALTLRPDGSSLVGIAVLCEGCGTRTRAKHRGLQAGNGAARARERRAASTSRDVMRKRERKRGAHRRCRAYIEVTTTGDAAMFMFKK
jgi:hypothetical protein